MKKVEEGSDRANYNLLRHIEQLSEWFECLADRNCFRGKKIILKCNKKVTLNCLK